MSDRDERSNRLSQRFDDEPDDADDQPDESQSDKASKRAKTSKTDLSEETPVKDRPTALMYLPEELIEELDIRFDELNARYKREHGEALGKNRHWYPAVIKAGLEGKDLEEILDL